MLSVNKFQGLISVIIPVYNVEKYLGRCLESVLNQTYKNLEIILVDDGSKDNSGKICDEFALKDKRIKVIHKENGGLSSARNAGLKIAKGEFIGFVDSDDWIDYEMYEVLYKLMIEKKTDISCGNIVRTTKEFECNNKRKVIEQVYSKDEFAKMYFKVYSQETVHYVVNKLYRREVAMKMTFPEGLINEDVEGFFYALSVSKKVAVTNQVTYYYWQNSDSISSVWFSKKQMDLLVVWKNVWSESKRSNNEKWQYYAQMNYYRAHLGLLCRLALHSDLDNNKFNDEKRILIKKLKENYWSLIKYSLPINRKIIMTAMVVNYDLTRLVIQMFFRLKNRR